MLRAETGRVTDPVDLSAAEIVDYCGRGNSLVVQFTTPDTCTASNLNAVNEAFKHVQDGLQVRFYGHYRTPFDGRLLRQLPNARDLAIDCLSEISNEDEISRLPNLKRLSFGVFDFNRPEFLNALNLGNLQKLELHQNRRRNLNLAPLAKCESLEDLHVEGHAKGIEATSGLPYLRELTLRAYAKANSLGFISTMPSLKQLSLVLGGRDEISDLSSNTLETLQITLVRGLNTVGDLSRIPKLASLRIEDQAKLTQLDLRGTSLQVLRLINCKTLSSIIGLELQEHLREFGAFRVALDLDHLRDRAWPPSTRSVNLVCGSRKWNDAAKQALAARGLAGKSNLWDR